jgi:uncharacterized protein YcbK (DUF882 family)
MLFRGYNVRRAVFGAGFIALAIGVAMGHQANASGEVRTLSLYEIHTKETLTVTFKRDGKFDEEGLKKLNHFMRDWRADEETHMDRELIDLIWALHQELGSKKPIHLVSGYRSAKTNAKMRKRGGGQAKKSQHIQGKAADLHFPDVSAKALRNSALVHEVGGVGYYPTSGLPFVHVDTGRVRMWPRIPRLELAALYPSGHTDYVPRGGGHITKKDYRLALAKGLVSNRTMVASAAPMPTPKPPALAPEVAQPILASYTPDQPVAAPQAATPPAAPRFTYASAAGGGFKFPRPSLLPAAEQAQVPAYGSAPTYQSAKVVGAPEFDDDHPDELSYTPFETASLMTDESLAFSRTVAPLTHPEQRNIDYLFKDMDRPTGFKLRRSSGYRNLASVQKFSGKAVRSLYAAMKDSGPIQLAQTSR